MATYYYNWVTGSNSTGDGSLGNPWKFPISSHGAAGDTFLLRRGQTFYTSTQFGWTPRMANGVNGLWTTVDTYGDSDTQLAGFDSYHPTGPTINISASLTENSNLRFKNLWVKATSHTSIPLFIHANQTDIRNVEVIGCRITGRPGGSKNALLYISSDFPETMLCYNILADSCIMENSPGHGAFVVSTIGMTYRNCIARNNGLEEGAHGFSSVRQRTNITSGWSGGPSIYTQSFSYTDISSVTLISGSSTNTYPRLNKNTASPTNPSPGEFGYTGGVLYVNLNGADPNGQTLNAAYGTLTNVRYEYCEAYDNNAFSNYPYWEGHGIALDDYTGESKVIGCHLYNNQGAGLSINRGDNNDVFGNLIYGNLLSGIQISRGKNNRVYNNTVVNNNQANTLYGYTSSAIAAVSANSMSTGTNIQNNIVTTQLAYGITIDSQSNSGSSADRNNITGFKTSAVNGITATNTTQLDPQLSPLYVPQTGLQGIGNTLGGRDFYNKPFKAAPTLGAIEVYTSNNTITTHRGVAG